MKRLRILAKANNIKIQFADLDTPGMWMPSIRKIKIDREGSRHVKIASLLHELGHSIDDMLLFHFTSESKLFKAYAAVDAAKPTPKQLSMVLDCENRAWDAAVDMARFLKIPLGKWFFKFKRQCIATYRKV